MFYDAHLNASFRDLNRHHKVNINTIRVSRVTMKQNAETNGTRNKANVVEHEPYSNVSCQETRRCG